MVIECRKVAPDWEEDVWWMRWVVTEPGAICKKLLEAVVVEAVWWLSASKERHCLSDLLR